MDPLRACPSPLPTPPLPAAGRPARPYCARLRAFRPSDSAGLRLAALRLGLPPDLVPLVEETIPASRLGDAALSALGARVAAEVARLARLGRARDPRYDVNRHLGALRLRRWLAEAGAGGGHEPGTGPSPRP